jgi:general secretion pathway protein J
MSRRRDGFTLLEVVLAMTALALLSAICYAAFQLAIRAMERGEVAVVTAQRLRVAADVLIRQIKSTVPYPARNKDFDVYPYFVGSATSMTFITAAGLHGGGGLDRIVYQVVADPPRLVLSESPYFSPDVLGEDTVDTSGGETTVLLDGFRNLKFEYLLNDGADTEWRPTWDGHEEEMLPIAVRILVEGLPGLELDVWGQEIPIMATGYGENTGEVDEEDLGPSAEEVEGEEPDETGGAAGGAAEEADGE